MIAISVISEIELLASPAMEPGDEVIIERLLTTLDILALSSRIGRRAAELRRRTKLRLGDAAIAATASIYLATLATRDHALRTHAEANGIRVASV